MNNTQTIVACLDDLSALCAENGITKVELGAALVAYGAGVLLSAGVPLATLEAITRQTYTSAGIAKGEHRT